MTVYVDDMQRRARVGRLNAVWSHLTADTDDELHEFAAKLGLKRAWHQKPGTPISHYDVTEPKRQLAIRLGAVPIGYFSEESKDIIRRKIAKRDAAKAGPVMVCDEDAVLGFPGDLPPCPHPDPELDPTTGLTFCLSCLRRMNLT
ncbi:uncharacterized protein RMCC_5875 [Mycolicibacterium canariasense]|uniref:DUF4031 domain-containing protein n=1 Tax=Mycolicibacterium canariasense TaxID=228230 RepID=A0A124E355_MYCCR|nr:DUF4031 domain-containing protein [Mycolicibacterium canariasense]MCV7210528.1 DUF4031 domain-containing protein [Mycolicibacterium canariasense]ORU96135.1 hypothetical protein AWB94_31215 [Mycolicibacterium canariasense]GAS98910.1 uncharacterized protein RMCC_5875 [Mycolicibacterium canariasense]